MKIAIKLLETKYGSWKKEKKYFFNCEQFKYRNPTRLNLIYNEPKYNQNLAFLSKENVVCGSDLLEFYKNYNGLSFFQHSFVIFGYQPSLEIGYVPLDMASMNRNLKIRHKNWNNDFVSIGEYGKYDFCLYKGDNQGTIYIVDRETSKIANKFKTFNDLIEYSVAKLLTMYDKDGYKIGVSKNTVPIHNISLEDIY